MGRISEGVGLLLRIFCLIAASTLLGPTLKNSGAESPTIASKGPFDRRMSLRRILPVPSLVLLLATVKSQR